VDHGVGDPFGGEQKQGENCKSDLEALGIELLLCDGLLAPQCRWLVAQASDFSHYIKIEDGAKKGESHHGNADGVLMKTPSGSVDACGSGERA